MPPTDHELMHRCREDASSFDHLVERWQPPVQRAIARLLGPTADVDDLSQEVFLRIYGARHRYQPRAAFSTWLYRIVLNVSRDAHRRRWRQRVPLVDEPWVETEDPHAAAQLSELRSGVSRALARLRPRHREVIVLRHFTDLTFSEIAEALDQPESTVKSRLRVALEKLHHELSRQGFAPQELEE